MAPSSVRFSRPVIVGNIAGVSTIAPTRRITAGRPSGVVEPSTAVRPAVAATSPSRQRIVVVFPDPFGPRNPNTPPSGTDRSSPCTATLGAFRHRRYSLRSPSTSITAVMHGQTNCGPSRVTRSARTRRCHPRRGRRASVSARARPSKAGRSTQEGDMDGRRTRNSGLGTPLVAAVVLGLGVAGGSTFAGADAEHGWAVLVDLNGNEVGNARFTEDATGAVHVNVHVQGMSPGLHGIHIHANGSCGNGFADALGAPQPPWRSPRQPRRRPPQPRRQRGRTRAPRRHRRALHVPRRGRHLRRRRQRSGRARPARRLRHPTDRRQWRAHRLRCDPRGLTLPRSVPQSAVHRFGATGSGGRRRPRCCSVHLTCVRAAQHADRLGTEGEAVAGDQRGRGQWRGRVERVQLDGPDPVVSGVGDGELERFPPPVDEHEEFVVDEQRAVLGPVWCVIAVEVDAETTGGRVGPVLRRHRRAARA